MITAKILNSAATLNNYQYLNALQFVPGAQITLVIQLFDTQLNLRRIPDVSAIITGVFNNTDGTTLNKTFTPLADDRSILSVTLEEAETLLLVGGSFTIQEDVLGDTTNILLGFVNSGLVRVITGDC